VISTKDIDLHRQLIDIDRADCEESLYVYLRSAWHVFDSAPWLDGWAIDVIAEHLQAVIDGELRRLIINVPPRFAKPLAGSSIINTTTGLRRLDDISVGDEVLTHKGRWRRVLAVHHQGVLPVVKLRTTRGREVIAAPDHPFLTPEGWQEVGKLIANDVVGTIPLARKRRFDFDQAIRGEVVESIQPDGESDCICLTVEEDHSFVANGFAVHNSALCSVALTGWTWAQPKLTHTSGPGVSFLYASFREDLSRRDSVACRRIIESKWYQDRWGSRFKLSDDQNTKSRFTNDKGGYRLITSIESKGATGDGANCFVAGTQVDTPTGRKNIEDLRVGDAVLAFDLQRWKVVTSSVLATAHRPSNELCTLHSVSGHRLVCTEDHPIFSPVRGFVRASEMGPEDVILAATKNDAQSDYNLRALSQKPLSPHIHHVSNVCNDSSTTHDVYDIQVEGQNNFFANGILVHNCIILDDCNSAKEVESELVIASTLEWFDGTLGTRLNNQKLGAVINVQQRLGENDITGHVLSKNTGEWCHLVLPMEYEPERSFHNAYGWKDPRTRPGELLWPERFGPDEVTALKNWMGNWRSAGQLQQRPQPRGGGVIQRVWWQLWERDALPPMDFILGTLDTAYTLEKMNDPSGMIIWGVFSGDPVAQMVRTFGRDGSLHYTERSEAQALAPKVMLTHAWTDRLEFYQLIKKTAETCIKCKVDLLLIENKAAGISVAQELRRLYGHERFSVQLFDPKSQDKFARLVSVQHLFQEKLIYAPNKDWAEDVITQVEQFPRGKHDEYVDLTSMGLRYLRERGLISRAVERRAEMDSLVVYPRNQNIPLYPA
jgi:predicted phage terminase large subunit-like protein